MPNIALRPLLYLCIALVMNLAFMDIAWAKAERLRDHYIVTLDGPPAIALAEKQSNVAGKTKMHFRSMVQQQQKVIAEQIKKSIPTVSIKRRFDTLLNAMEVSLDEKELDSLLSLPGVKRVYPVKMRYGHLDTSHQVIKSIEAWSLQGGQQQAGKGIKIAIIDSGIQPDNPMFSDAGFEAPDLSDNNWLSQNPDYCRMEGGDPNFCNNKVIIARVSEPTDDIFILDPTTDLTPLDSNRHGSHVAGIAAGNPIDVTFEGVDVSLSGVAPGAYLMIYKALFDNGGSSGAQMPCCLRHWKMRLTMALTLSITLGVLFTMKTPKNQSLQKYSEALNKWAW